MREWWQTKVTVFMLDITISSGRMIHALAKTRDWEFIPGWCYAPWLAVQRFAMRYIRGTERYRRDPSIETSLQALERMMTARIRR